jgi:hypothetical protein
MPQDRLDFRDRLGSFDFREDEDYSGRVAAEFLESVGGVAEPACRVCGTPTDEAGALCDDCADDEAELAEDDDCD